MIDAVVGRAQRLDTCGPVLRCVVRSIGVDVLEDIDGGQQNPSLLASRRRGGVCSPRHDLERIVRWIWGGLAAACVNNTPIVPELTTPTTPPEIEPVDADGDGARSDVDCDDDDPLRYPGAAERCDGVDNDCDREVDEEPVDGFDAHADVDGDGFGDPTRPVKVCELREGVVANTLDCDDTATAINPNAPEVCDGVDNDCDGKTDLERVPLDHPTLQDAADRLPDGGQACVAPGTYLEALVLAGRRLTFRAAEGPAGTVLDLGGDATGSAVTVTGAASDVAFVGFTITGLDRAIDAPTDEAAFARVSDGHLRLTDVVFQGNRLRLVDAGRTLRGGLVRVVDGQLTLVDVTVADTTFEFAPDGGDDVDIDGGVVYAENSALVVEDLLATGLVAQSTAFRNGDLDGLLLQSRLGTTTIDGLAIEAPRVSIVAGNRLALAPAFVSLRDEGVDVANVALRDALLELSGARTDVVGLIGFEGTDGVIDQVELLDTTIDITGASDSAVEGVLRVDAVSPALSLRHVTARGTTVRLVNGSVRGGSLSLRGAFDARWLDVRGGVVAAEDARGAGIAVIATSQGAPMTLANLVVAGNRAEGPVARGGGLVLSLGGYATIENADFFRNVVSGATAQGAGLFEDDPRLGLLVENASFVENVVATPGDAAAGWFEAGTPLALSHVNAFANVGDSEFAGVTGNDLQTGSLAVDPGYVDVSSADPAQWDLTLAPSSPLRDAGNPALTDGDGTVSDVGAYGGAGSLGW